MVLLFQLRIHNEINISQNSSVWYICHVRFLAYTFDCFSYIYILKQNFCVIKMTYQSLEIFNQLVLSLSTLVISFDEDHKIK